MLFSRQQQSARAQVGINKYLFKPLSASYLLTFNYLKQVIWLGPYWGTKIAGQGQLMRLVHHSAGSNLELSEAGTAKDTWKSLYHLFWSTQKSTLFKHSISNHPFKLILPVLTHPPTSILLGCLIVSDPGRHL